MFFVCGQVAPLPVRIFRDHLDAIINPRQALVRLAGVCVRSAGWPAHQADAADGRAALPEACPRDLPDEEVVERWGGESDW